MVKILKHQLNILNRRITNYGVVGTISTMGENEYGEHTKPLNLFDIKGFFHTQNNYVSVNIKNSGESFKKTQPMFLTMYNNRIKQDDLLSINNTIYKIIDINNINNLNIVVDLSLEVI